MMILLALARIFFPYNSNWFVIYNISQMDEKPQQMIVEKSPSLVQSPEKLKELKREKKRKLAAFQSFLTKADSSEITPKRKQSDDEELMERVEDGQCKICKEQLSEKHKLCQFCKDVVCLSHMRKKRKYKNTGKFVRICDECEDKHLYDKYMKLEMKAEESLTTQQLIIAAKHSELKDLITGKEVKLQLLRNKRATIEQECKLQNARLATCETDLTSKTKKLETKEKGVCDQAVRLEQFQKSLPRPLQEDYNALVEQNNKITKELVKYQKLCNEAIKAKSAKEKEMYQEYYQWERIETEKKKAAQKDDCAVC